MNLNDLRPKFLIYTILDQVEASSEFRLNLIAQGYQVEVFLDEEALYIKMQSQVPHLIVFHTRALPLGPESFFKRVLNFNGEVYFVAVTMPSNYEQLESYYSYNLYEHIVEGPHYLRQLLRSCDRFVSFQSQFYLNEKLFLKNQALESQSSQAQKSAEALRSELTEIKKSQPLAVLDTYLNRPPGQSLIDLFFLRLSALNSNSGPGEVFFLNYIASTSSLLLTHIYNSKFNFSEQVTSWPQLAEFEMQKFVRLNELPGFITKSLAAIQSQADWKFSYAFSDSDNLNVLIWNSELLSSIDFETENKAATLAQKMNAQQSSETGNHSTEAQFLSRFENEKARSIRLQLPVSFLNIRILAGETGAEWSSEMESTFFQFLKKLLRPYDFYSRFQKNQYAVALPHCRAEDAFKLAERIRLSLEKHSQIKWGVKLKVFQGVTSFPHFSSSLSECFEQTEGLLASVDLQSLSQTFVFQLPPSAQNSEAKSV